MWRYLFSRLAQALPVVIGVVTVVFFMIHLLPGDPVDIMLRESVQVADHDRIKALLGLDRPLIVQYFDYWKRLFHGDLGQSFIHLRPVKELLWTRLPYTALLAFSSLCLSCALAIPTGVFAAQSRGSSSDRVLLTLAAFSMSVPIFVVAPLAILLFAIKLRLLPVGGAGTFSHLILPVLCLSLSLSGLMTRMVRTSVLEHLAEDFVRTARAKGLSHVAVLFKHVLIHASIPVLTLATAIFGSLLAGAVLTETIFDWPGMGRLFYAAFQERDFPLVQGIVLWISIVYVVLNILVDLIYAWIDPRVRLSLGIDR